ncbi:MAG: hypothetical protein JWO95_566 [Verrucomicrobiales bacterium]|nr:hypothetical protein [Verrucomicrobiales bacterium]
MVKVSAVQTKSSGRVLKFAIILPFLFFATVQLHATTYFVNVNPSSFSPSTANIAVGDSVIWQNQDDTFSHTVTSTTGLWTAGYLLDYQDTFGLTFNSAGTFPYYDQFDNFTGTVVVSSASGPPANDLCSGAVAMTAGTPYSVNTANATSTSDPTSSCGTIGKGVWYTFSTSSSGAITISTCGSSFDTMLAIYTGSCGALTQVSGGCNDDNGPGCVATTASLTFNATAGVTYRVLAGGKSGASGNLNIVATLPPPTNDQCNGAIAMTAGTVYTMNTATATATGDPAPSCGSTSKGVWYSYTPGASDTVTISTCGSDFDTILAAYTGTCGSLVEVAGACNDDNGPSCTGTAASINFSAVAGTTYRIFVGGYAAGTGNLQIVATGGVAAKPIQIDQRTYTLGQFQQGFSSDPGNFLVQSSSNLVQWSTVTNITSTGHAIAIDTPGAPARFYRVKTP